MFGAKNPKKKKVPKVGIFSATFGFVKLAVDPPFGDKLFVASDDGPTLVNS